MDIDGVKEVEEFEVIGILRIPIPTQICWGFLHSERLMSHCNVYKVLCCIVAFIKGYVALRCRECVIFLV